MQQACAAQWWSDESLDSDQCSDVPRRHLSNAFRAETAACEGGDSERGAFDPAVEPVMEEGCDKAAAATFTVGSSANEEEHENLTKPPFEHPTQLAMLAS